MSDMICLFCGADATWNAGEIVCLEHGHHSWAWATLDEYERDLFRFGCPLARERMVALIETRGRANVRRQR